MQANRFSNPGTGNGLEFYTCNGLRQGAWAKAVKGRIVKAGDVWGWLWTAGYGFKGWHPASSPLPFVIMWLSDRPSNGLELDS